MAPIMRLRCIIDHLGYSGLFGSDFKEWFVVLMGFNWSILFHFVYSDFSG